MSVGARGRGGCLCLLADGPGKTLLLVPGVSSLCQRPPAPCAIPGGRQVSREEELLCRHSLRLLARMKVYF